MKAWLIPAPLVVLLVLSALHLTLGAASIDLGVILAAFTAYDPTNYAHVVVIFQRLTRLAVALYAGAALGVSGLLLQKIMQNGLVSPGTLGINAGATTFVVLGVFLLGLSGPGLFLPALLGGIISVMLTLLVSRLLTGQGDPKLNLVLAGSMIGALFSALTTFVLSMDPDSFGNIIGWIVGDIGNFDYQALAPMAPIGLLALIAAAVMSRAVDILVLGDEQAAVMGVNVRLVYGGTLLVAIVLAVSAVTVVGPIGFVGLVMPHIARILVGEIGRLPLWLCLVGGAALLTGADILARLLMAPRVLNVGTVMGFAGGLVFLALVIFGTRRSER
ncbi:iron complex transport system permease protein [Devosia sp. YR412]|uniref:FecCD family ABC transporter permease n=1 Tax=Devosia sp. YR412 TaxID=1881030 RepID=UPI0008C1EE0B|nr:iron ABC transporter permease [Devosia sp. YR412]SEQ61591.1 iron complex transport system permease protein [Devosia sp. YR412]